MPSAPALLLARPPHGVVVVRLGWIVLIPATVSTTIQDPRSLVKRPDVQAQAVRCLRSDGADAAPALTRCSLPSSCPALPAQLWQSL